LLSVRTNLSVNPEAWKDSSSEEEKALWTRVEPCFKASDQKYGVAKHPLDEAELARQMTELGFRDISTGYLAQTTIPDNAGVDRTLAQDMIESGRQVALDAVVLARTLAPEALSDAEVERLRWLIDPRFDRRIRLLQSGKRIWDVSASVLMAVRGRKSLPGQRF